MIFSWCSCSNPFLEIIAISPLKSYLYPVIPFQPVDFIPYLSSDENKSALWHTHVSTKSRVYHFDAACRRQVYNTSILSLWINEDSHDGLVELITWFTPQFSTSANSANASDRLTGYAEQLCFLQPTLFLHPALLLRPNHFHRCRFYSFPDNLSSFTFQKEDFPTQFHSPEQTPPRMHR